MCFVSLLLWYNVRRNPMFLRKSNAKGNPERIPLLQNRVLGIQSTTLKEAKWRVCLREQRQTGYSKEKRIK